MSRRVGAATLLLATIAASAAVAQVPGLQHRAANPPATETLVATGHTGLPPTAEGEYRWGKLGEEIEIYFEEGRLHGYLTERAPSGSDRSAPITFDFATTHADGHALSWTTRVVQGVSWSFDGHLERGLVASPRQPGFICSRAP